MDRASSGIEDPRVKSHRYSKFARTKFDPEQFDFQPLQFLIDDHYVGEPPRVQVSIDNLNDNINEDFLRKELMKSGKTRSLEIIRHPVTKAHLGMAKIQFETVSAAQSCIDTWNEKSLMGHKLSVFEDPRFSRIEMLKEEKLNPRPAPRPAPTISTTLSTFSTFSTPVISTPEPSSRPKLDERIASLMQRPDSLLSTIVAQPPMPAAFNEYPNNNYHNENRRPEVNHLNNANHYSNHREPYQRYVQNEMNNQVDDYQKTLEDTIDEWNTLPFVETAIDVKKEPFEIRITESQVYNLILPYTFREFNKDMYNSLRQTLSRRLIEKHGYPILEKEQNGERTRRDLKRLEEEKAREEEKKKEALTVKFFRNDDKRLALPSQYGRLSQQFFRRREVRSNHHQDDKHPPMPQRINRSAAIEPERRGSHNTNSSSSSEGSTSDSESNSDDELSSDSDSSASTTSSSSYSASSSNSSQSSRPSSGSSVRRRTKRIKLGDVSSHVKDPDTKIDVTQEVIDREEVANSLILLANQPTNPSSNEVIDKPQKTIGNKRKKKIDENSMSVASEYRAAKRFASDPGDAFGSIDENIENAIIGDENFLKDLPEVTFPKRSEVDKERMIYDLSSLSEEDIGYLIKIYEESGLGLEHKDEQTGEVMIIKFPGSLEANKAHLGMKRNIEPELTKSSSHPKWWNGCSRCSVIPKDDKDKPSENEELDYADLKMAPIKSHVIQAASTNSSRRDHRGDQRRIAASNPDINEEILRAIVSNTLKVSFRFEYKNTHFYLYCA